MDDTAEVCLHGAASGYRMTQWVRQKEEKMKYRAKDIAREVGVSPATVSLVLNNRPGVGEKKRREIVDKIVELGCEYLLRGDEADRTEQDDVGFVIYKCRGTIIEEYPVFNYMSESITKALEKHNYRMNIMYLNKEDSPAERRQALENLNCAGFIVYAVEMYAEDIETFSELDVPCVFLDNPFYDAEVDVVTVDNYWGIQQEFEYLYERGHREIGYIKSKIPIECFDERYDAYCRMMQKKGLEIQPDYIMHLGYLEKETGEDVKNYLAQQTRLPTAFLADNDLLGCRALRIFKKKGIEVPEEVSFVGFDNRRICSFVEPSMTTIELPSESMGEIAVEILMKRINRDDGVRIKCKVIPKLIKKHSVKEIR